MNSSCKVIIMKRFLRLALVLFCAALIAAVYTANVNAATISRSVTAGLDDAEEHLDGGTPGNVDVTSSDIELAVDGPPDPRQLVGLRFTNITIPRGALIQNAAIQFMVDETDTEADTDVRIFGELAPNSAQFAATPMNITARTRTSSSVVWNDIPVWTNPGTGDCTANCPAGPDQRTPNIASVLQQIVNQPGWTSGNALSILIEPDPLADNTGERTAVSADRALGTPGLQAPTLLIEFIPEPTSCVLALVAAFAGALARRRRA
jgi:hypothetical protein